MKVSDIIHVGTKIDIRVLQEIEQAEKTDGIVKTYKSKMLGFCTDGNIEIAMPIESGKLVLPALGVRYEMVFFTGNSLYRAIGQVKERYKKENVYMLEMEFKSQLQKFQRREFFRHQCMLDFRYYEITSEQAQMDDTAEILKELRDEHFAEKELFGRIVDLSGGGIRFLATHELERNAWFLAELKLKSQTIDSRYYIAANVIDVKETELTAEKKGYIIRAKFSIQDDSVREDIIRYIFEEERKKRQQK